MSDKAPAFQFYARDFLADGKVRLMSCAEVGAYLLLLLHQWTEGEIPGEISALAVICRVTPAKMRRMWAHLDACFQIDSDGKLRNPRMEAVRLEQQGFREKQRAKAEQRWAGKRDATAMLRHDSGIDSASSRHMPEACSASASATAKENTPPCSPPSGDDERSRHEPAPDGWESFWAEYPRKDGKRTAFRAFCKIRPDPLLLAAMLAALNEQKASKRWRESNGEFIPHASTWLNGRRWEDRGVEGLETVPGRLGYGNTANDRTQRNLANAEAALRIIRSRGSPDGDRIG